MANDEPERKTADVVRDPTDSAEAGRPAGSPATSCESELTAGVRDVDPCAGERMLDGRGRIGTNETLCVDMAD